MTVDRQVLMSKLTQYLQDEISGEEMYQWVLGVAVSDAYADIASQDPLLKETVQALLDMQRKDLREVPTKKALEYYRRCLAGEEEFIPLKERTDLASLNIPDDGAAKGAAVSGDRPRKSFLERIVVILRFYVVLFGLAVLGLYVISFLQPDFLGLKEHLPQRSGLLAESLPHILYAVMILLPMRITARGVVFYLVFPALVLGMIYFWAVPVKLFQSPALILIALPFSAVPATLAVILLARQKEKLK